MVLQIASLHICIHLEFSSVEGKLNISILIYYCDLCLRINKLELNNINHEI